MSSCSVKTSFARFTVWVKKWFSTSQVQNYHFVLHIWTSVQQNLSVIKNEKMNHLPKRYVLLMIRKAWLTHSWDLSLRGDDVFHVLLDHHLTRQTQTEQNVKYLNKEAISSSSCQTCSKRAKLQNTQPFICIRITSIVFWLVLQRMPPRGNNEAGYSAIAPI